MIQKEIISPNTMFDTRIDRNKKRYPGLIPSKLLCTKTMKDKIEVKLSYCQIDRILKSIRPIEIKVNDNFVTVYTINDVNKLLNNKIIVNETLNKIELKEENTKYLDEIVNNEEFIEEEHMDPLDEIIDNEEEESAVQEKVEEEILDEEIVPEMEACEIYNENIQEQEEINEINNSDILNNNEDEVIKTLYTNDMIEITDKHVVNNNHNNGNNRNNNGNHNKNNNPQRRK